MCLQHIHCKELPALLESRQGVRNYCTSNEAISIFVKYIVYVKNVLRSLKSNQSVNSFDMRKHSWEKDFLLRSFFSLIPSLWEFQIHSVIYPSMYSSSKVLLTP